MATDIEQAAPTVNEPARRELETASTTKSTPQPESSQAGNSHLYSARNIIAVTVWFGLLGGMIEGANWTYKQLFAGYMVFFPAEVFWMSALTVLTFAAVPGVLFALAALVARRRAIFLAAVTAVAAVACVNSLIVFVKLHIYAHILLGLALGTVAARIFGKYTEQTMRFVNRTVVWLVLIAAGVIATQTGVQTWKRQTATVGRPAAPADAPNVILLVLDTVRDALTTYGGDASMAPNLHRWAKRGVVFDQAWATAPWTLPSQAGMFTGLLPSEISANWYCRLNNSYPILAEQLAANGWQTGGFVANTMYCSSETGLARGFDHYEDYPVTAGQAVMCSAIFRKFILSALPTKFDYYDKPCIKPAAKVNAAALRWLDAREDRPFFLFLNYLDAHDPYFAPSEFKQDSLSHQEMMILRSWWWRRKEKMTPQQMEMVERAYENCLRGLDADVGRLLADLEQRKVLDNTIIIITADHGEHFGEHDLYLHGNSLYEPLLRVPLMVIAPNRIEPGTRVTTPVTLADLPASVMQLAGLKNKSPFPGKSWSRYLAREAAAAPAAMFAETMTPPRHAPCHGHSPVHRGAMRAVRRGKFKYIRNGDGVEELFNIGVDPLEKNDLAQDAAHQTQLQQLRKLLDKRLDRSTVNTRGPGFQPAK